MSFLKVDDDYVTWTWTNPDQCRTTGCATKGCSGDPESTCATTGVDMFPGASGCDRGFGELEYFTKDWISSRKSDGYPKNAVITNMREWSNSTGWSGIDLVSMADYKNILTNPTNPQQLDLYIAFGTMNYTACRGTPTHSNGKNGMKNTDNTNFNGEGYGLSGIVVRKGTCRLVGIAYRWHYVPNPLDTTHKPVYSFVGSWPDLSITDKIVAGQVVGDADLKGEYATYYPELMRENPDPSPKRIHFIGDIKLTFSGIGKENSDTWPCAIRGIYRIIALQVVSPKCKAPTGQTCTNDGKFVDIACATDCGSGKKCEKGQCVDDKKQEGSNNNGDDTKDKDKDKDKDKGKDGGGGDGSGGEGMSTKTKIIIGVCVGLGGLLLLIGLYALYKRNQNSPPPPPTYYYASPSSAK